MFNNQIEDFKKLQRFETKDSFNKSFYHAMKLHKDAFTKGELIALKTLKNWGVKILGVVYAKLGTIISDLIKRKGEYAPKRSTFERAIRKAKKLGIINVIALKQGSDKKNRKNLKGNNLYIFGIFSDSEQMTEREGEKLTERENAENPCHINDSEGYSEGDTSKTLYTTPIKDIKIRKNDVPTELNSEYVSNKVPEYLKVLIKPFYDSKKIIEDCYYNAMNIFRKYKMYDFANDEEVLESVLREATKSLAHKTIKDKKLLDKPVGYFTRTIQAIVNEEAQEERFNMYEEARESTKEPVIQANSHFYNWLDERY